MKSTIFLFVAMLLTSATTIMAQNNSPYFLTESRTSKPYHHIIIKGELNVKLVQDETPLITITGNKYQLDNTVTLLVKDTLYVYQANTREKDSKAYVTINVENLSLLEVRGKTKVDCSGLINTDFFTIRAHDGARVKVDVHALKVDSKATGWSVIDVSGSAARVLETTDGTGIIDSHLLDVIGAKATTISYCAVC